LVPAPQGAEQALQAPQDPTQLTAHACVLQDVDWVAPLDAEQALPPPDAAVLTLYDRDFVPPPHDSLQLPQLPQAPWQFTTGGGGGGGGAATAMVTAAALWCEL
jgi:hypothetical protein